MFALTRGDVVGWGSGVILASAAGAAVLLAAFVAVERGQPEPMLDLGLFAIPTFTGASVVVLVMAASTFGPFLYLTLFLLDGAGTSAPRVAMPRAMPTWRKVLLTPEAMPLRVAGTTPRAA